MPEAMGPILVMASRLGPPRLFDGEAEAGAGVPSWALVLRTGLGLLILFFALREIRRRTADAERLAFHLLARRFGLRKAERKAVARLAQREGVDALGLLICESAFVRATAGRSEAKSAIVESKPILLTKNEVNELGRVAERLFGFGALDRLEQHATRTEEEHPHGDDEQPSRWVA